MLLQLLGRQGVGDRYGTVTLPSNVLPEGLLELTLVNYYACTNPDHLLHFAEDNRVNLVDYPQQEDPLYEEYINVRVPRPVQITGNRRRTVQFYNVVEAPQFVADEDGVTGGQLQNRHKRSLLQVESNNVPKRVRRDVSPYQLEVTLEFDRGDLYVVEPYQGLNSKTVTFFITNVFNVKLSNRRKAAFQNLFKNNFSLTPAPLPGDAKSGNVILNVPPRQRIGFVGKSSQEYLTSLGFSINDYTVTEEVVRDNAGNEQLRSVAYFTNESFDDYLSIKSKFVVKYSATLDASFVLVQPNEVLKANRRPALSSPHQVAVKFEFLDPAIVFKCALSEDNVARHRRRYTVEFFTQLLEDVRILMQFHPGIFEVGFADDGTNRLVFKKIHIPDKAEAIKFRVSFDFGHELADQLGFRVPPNDPMFSFTWSPLSGAKNHALTDELTEDGDDGEDDQTVRTKVAGMRVALKNLEGPYPPLEQMRVQHLAMVEELENQKRLAADAAAAAAAAARPPTPPPRTPSPDDVPVVAEANPDPEGEDIFVEAVEEPPPPDAEPNEAEEIGPEVGEGEEEGEGGEGEEEEAEPPVQDPYEIIRIPNPTPRRARQFKALKYAPTVRLHPVPEDFPNEFSIIIREGEPRDFIADRGYVSVLGMVRAESPRIISNKCYLKNTGQRISQLKLEILDSHLNSWRPNPNNAAADVPDSYFKVDFICNQVKYSTNV
jgi:hypothetical protein